LNTGLSLIYYVKVLKVMILDKPLEEVEGTPVAPLVTPVGQNAYLSALAIIVLLLGVFWGPLYEMSLERGTETFTRPVVVQQARGR